MTTANALNSEQQSAILAAAGQVRAGQMVRALGVLKKAGIVVVGQDATAKLPTQSKN